jgi:antitoxin component HigA of HigAB toxin-antitoxin module
MKPVTDFRDDIDVFSSLIDNIMSEYGVTMEDISLSIDNSPGLISRIINRVKLLTNFEIEELDKEFNDFNFKEKLRSKIGG